MGEVIKFPTRQPPRLPPRIAICRGCRALCRHPHQGACSDCWYWTGQWRELQRNVASMQAVH